MVILQYALHLKTKYYHTQMDQIPSVAVSNHTFPMCGLVPELNFQGISPFLEIRVYGLYHDVGYSII